MSPYRRQIDDLFGLLTDENCNGEVSSLVRSLEESYLGGEALTKERLITAVAGHAQPGYMMDIVTKIIEAIERRNAPERLAERRLVFFQ